MPKDYLAKRPSLHKVHKKSRRAISCNIGQKGILLIASIHIPDASSFRDAAEASAVSLIFDREGKRKYLTVSERTAFLDAAARMPADVRTILHRARV